MDVELFSQMLTNNAYDGQSLYNLVHFVFDKIAALEAPARADRFDVWSLAFVDIDIIFHQHSGLSTARFDNANRNLRLRSDCCPFSLI